MKLCLPTYMPSIPFIDHPPVAYGILVKRNKPNIDLLKTLCMICICKDEKFSHLIESPLRNHIAIQDFKVYFILVCFSNIF